MASAHGSDGFGDAFSIIAAAILEATPRPIINHTENADRRASTGLALQ
jgi:hypothetical protein